MPAHPEENEYDYEKTEQAIHKHTGGNALDPLSMIYNDVRECFKQIGKNKTLINAEATANANQEARIESLESQLKSLQNRLWGLLAGVILAVVGGAITIYANSADQPKIADRVDIEILE